MRDAVPERADAGDGLSEAARELLRVRAREPRSGVASSGITSRGAPLSSFQESIYFFEQIEPELGLYNRPARLRLRGKLEVAALEQSFAETFRRHEILRSIVVVEDARQVQCAMTDYAFSLPVVDLAGLPEEERNERLVAIADTEARMPFDLGAGPFARATLIRLDVEEHVLLFTSHHIAFDGWSTGVLFRELGVLYSDFITQHESSMAAPSLQYADFARWQRERLSSDSIGADLAYWLERVTGAAPILELPADHPRPTARNHSAGRLSRSIPEELVDRLRVLGYEEGATLFMTMLAAFQLFVSRIAGREDVVVGVPVAGRMNPETEAMLGCFVNILAMRMRVERNLTFRELLRDVRRSALDAFAHQELPFDVLVDRLQPERSLGYTPVTQVLFNFRNTPTSSLILEGLDVVIEPTLGTTIVPDLELNVEQTPDGWRLDALYSTELFDSASIERWLGHFQTLLEGIADSPGGCVARLPLLTTSERRVIVEEWNDNSTAPDFETCLHVLFEAQVRRTPDSVAVVASDGSITYDELNRSANHLARDLASRGVRPGVLVGICMERRADMIVALLAVMKAGGAYLPLDPDYPLERLAFMVSDSGARLMLTQAGVGASLASSCPQTICIDGIESIRVNELGDTNLEGAVRPNDPAYVIYTSGSTGRPKGAPISHKSVCNFALRSVERHGFSAEDVVLHRTPLSFDASVWELYPTLISGGRLVLARAHAQGDPPYLTKLVEEQHVTIICVVPSLLQFLLQVPDIARRFASVRLVTSGGEAISTALQEHFFSTLSCMLHNGYGPSEATVHTTVWECARSSERHFVPIGRPLGNVQVYILDPDGEPVPIGVTGEIYIGGAGVSIGYINRPELNAERFVDDKFRGTQGARLYRSGDLARFGPDGVIEFLGRADGQLKLRGIRIEPGEIEAALMAAGGVSECVVIAREDQPGDVRLVAYIVAMPGGSTSERVLRDRLREKLLPQMVPSAFVFLQKFSLTPSGKIDRLALPMPGAVVKHESEEVRTRTPSEVIVTGAWSEVLSVGDIGLSDDFFDIGGHSLHAMRVMARIRESVGVDVPLRRIFDCPTIEALARAVDDAVLMSRNEDDLALLLAEVEATGAGEGQPV